MNLTAIRDSWINCEETQKIKSKVEPTTSRRATLKAKAIEMLNNGTANATVAKKLGLAKTSISRYKAELKAMPNRNNMNKRIRDIAWTDDMVRVIAENYKTKSASQIAKIINDKFGTNKTENAIHSKANDHGFPLSAIEK